MSAGPGLGVGVPGPRRVTACVLTGGGGAGAGRGLNHRRRRRTTKGRGVGAGRGLADPVAARPGGSWPLGRAPRAPHRGRGGGSPRPPALGGHGPAPGAARADSLRLPSPSRPGKGDFCKLSPAGGRDARAGCGARRRVPSVASGPLRPPVGPGAAGEGAAGALRGAAVRAGALRFPPPRLRRSGGAGPGGRRACPMRPCAVSRRRGGGGGGRRGRVRGRMLWRALPLEVWKAPPFTPLGAERCLGFVHRLWSEDAGAPRGLYTAPQGKKHLPWYEWASICLLESGLQILVKIVTNSCACKTLRSQSGLSDPKNPQVYCGTCV